MLFSKYFSKYYFKFGSLLGRKKYPIWIQLNSLGNKLIVYSNKKNTNNEIKSQGNYNDLGIGGNYGSESNNSVREDE